MQDVALKHGNRPNESEVIVSKCNAPCQVASLSTVQGYEKKQLQSQAATFCRLPGVFLFGGLAVRLCR